MQIKEKRAKVLTTVPWFGCKVNVVLEEQTAGLQRVRDMFKIGSLTAVPSLTLKVWVFLPMPKSMVILAGLEAATNCFCKHETSQKKNAKDIH